MAKTKSFKKLAGVLMKKNKPSQAIDYDILGELTGYALRSAQLLVFRDFIETLKPWGIRPAEFSVLVIISANPGLSQSQLAAALNIERSALLRLIDKLEGRDMITRSVSPTDRRAHELYLTDSGNQALCEMKPLARQHEQQMTGFLNASERRELQGLLKRTFFNVSE